MTSNERMALWATFNALLRTHGHADLVYSEARVWWERYASELELERTLRAKVDREWSEAGLT
jgi:hypothetical protein